MDAQTLMYVFCVEAIIYLLLYNCMTLPLRFIKKSILIFLLLYWPRCRVLSKEAIDSFYLTAL